MGYRLGVDIGTTYTAAAIYRNGTSEMLGLGNRAMQIPSVLYLRPEGGFLVGEAAEARSAAEPGRVVREFKRRIGDPVPILVAGSPFSAEALTARLLSYVVGVAVERQGGPPDSITVSHPANWGSYKMDLLRQAFLLADLTDVATCSEPEAAAITYASRQRVDDGACIAVYDLGGGTFDAAVLRNTAGHFTVLGTPEGIEHLGGVDFDEAVFQHVLRSAGIDLRSLDPEDPQLVFALDRLRRDCVAAKEALSTDTEAVVAVAVGTTQTTVRLTRSDLEDMLRPPLDETVNAMRRVLRSAEVDPTTVAAIVLVGGSSRIPLVSEMLVGAFRRPLAMDTHPKHDIALGAALIGAGDAALPVTAAPAPVPVNPPEPSSEQPTWQATVLRQTRGSAPRSSRRAWLAVAAAAVVAALVVVGIFVWPGGGTSSDGTGTSSTGASSTPSVSASSSPTGVVSRPQGPKLPDNVLVLGRSILDAQGQPTTVTLWTMTDTGASKHELIGNVPTGTINHGAAISYDRTTIAYVHRAPGTLAATGQIHLMASDGTQDRPLFAHPPADCPFAARPAFRPGDQVLAVPCEIGSRNRLFLVSLDGKILSKSLVNGVFGQPTFNAAGTKIAFWRAKRPGGPTFLAEVSVSGGPITRLTHGQQDSDPVFSPVDDAIAFRSGQAIWVLPPGGQPKQLTPGKELEQNPTWSPDGTQIAYQVGPDLHTDVAIINASTGAQVTRITGVGAETIAWAQR
jgi:molecular chaperone DnaK